MKTTEMVFVFGIVQISSVDELDNWLSVWNAGADGEEFQQVADMRTALMNGMFTAKDQGPYSQRG